jgi:hypothetical protein
VQNEPCILPIYITEKVRLLLAEDQAEKSSTLAGFRAILPEVYRLRYMDGGTKYNPATLRRANDRR